MFEDRRSNPTLAIFSLAAVLTMMTVMLGNSISGKSSLSKRPKMMTPPTNSRMITITVTERRRSAIPVRKLIFAPPLTHKPGPSYGRLTNYRRRLVVLSGWTSFRRSCRPATSKSSCS